MYFKFYINFSYTTKTLVALMMLTQLCLANEDIVRTELFDSNEITALASSYQDGWYKHLYQSDLKATKQANSDITRMMGLTQSPCGKPLFTMEQCLLLHRLFKERRLHYIKNAAIWSDNYQNWTDWVKNEPRDVLYIVSPCVRYGTQDGWQWLIDLAQATPYKPEPETNTEPLIQTYSNSRYELSEKEVRIQVLRDIDLAQGIVTKRTGKRPTCTNQFIKNLAR